MQQHMQCLLPGLRQQITAQTDQLFQTLQEMLVQNAVHLKPLLLRNLDDQK